LFCFAAPNSTTGLITGVKKFSCQTPGKTIYHVIRLLFSPVKGKVLASRFGGPVSISHCKRNQEEEW